MNAAMRFLVLAILTTLAAKLGTLTRRLRERLTLVEAILPICAICKNIRTESGDWEKVEIYVGNRHQTQFTHGVCPHCAEEHYPEYLG